MKQRTITENLLKEFETYLWECERSQITIRKYLGDIKRFREFVGNVEVKKENVLQYKTFLEEQYAKTSANSMLAALNTFFRFAKWDDLCVRQFRVQKKVYSPENEELTREEYFRLIYTAMEQGNERLALIIQTICGTGIRVSELRYITVEAVMRGEVCVMCKAKERVVFIVTALQSKILAYAKRQKIFQGCIFRTRTGQPINRSNVWKEMKELCIEADVLPDKVYPHNLRHLFARTFYGLEKDIAKLADVLGHSNINTTRIYIMTTGVEHRKRMEKMQLVVE